jgi:hypothetical protein
MLEKSAQHRSVSPSTYLAVYSTISHSLRVNYGRFLSGGIILGSPLSCTDLFLYTITLPAVSCDAPRTLSYTTLELESRVLLSSKKPASKYRTVHSVQYVGRRYMYSTLEAGFLDDKSTLDTNSRVV